MAEFSVFPTAYWAQRYPERLALVWESGNSALFSHFPSQFSWKALNTLVSQTISHLGLIPNQTVAYLGEHRLAGVLCYLATIASGSRIISLNPALTAIQRQHILADIQVDRVIDERDFIDFSPVSSSCPLTVFQQQIPATLTLTSGSTGNPKAVVHSVEQHLANARGVCELVDFSEQHCWLLSLPLFHVSGQGIIWRWLFKGAMLAIGEDKSVFYSMLSQVSHASLVPTQLQRYLVERTTEQVGHKVQHILLGGTYLPPALLMKAQQQGMCIYAGYGMTEMASTICAVAQENDNVGKPLYGREVKLVGDEIYLRGACLALGYWQQGRLVPLSLDKGWFATKDKGEWNERGQLKVIGRRDNMFISGGENIQPEQIEQCLYQSGLVKQIFILPIDDAEFGQRPVALVEFLTAFNQQALEKLQDFAKHRLEKFKQPIAYYPLDSTQYQTGIKLSRQQLQRDLNFRLKEKYDD